MTKSLRWNSTLLILGLPILIILSMIFLAKSALFTAHPDKLSIGITLDLILTVPLLYFILIRKTDISKFTIMPFFIGGIVIASLILPKDQQGLLSQIKTYVLPVVELLILGIVGFTFRKTYNAYKVEKGSSPDFYTAIKAACHKALPSGAARAFTTEISMVYYALINWKVPQLRSNQFSYHQKNGTAPLLNILIFVIAIEMFAIHILISNWSVVTAWILTGLSFYSAIQIFAISKSLSRRPIQIEEDHLIIRYGLFCEALIMKKEIEEIELKPLKKLEFDKMNRSFAVLKDIEKYNAKITMKEVGTMEYLYGIQKSFKTLAFCVDDLEGFKSQMQGSSKTS